LAQRSGLPCSLQVKAGAQGTGGDAIGVPSMITLGVLCPTHAAYILVMFDTRISGSSERLCREKAAWRGYADAEDIGENHTVLVVRPGGARELLT
jgi:hypothetical protein